MAASERIQRQVQTPWVLLGVAAALITLRVFFPEPLVRQAQDLPEVAEKVQWLKPEEVPQSPTKPLLYDFTAAWCAPCRKQAAEVFADEKAASFINEHFLPVKVADEDRKEKAVADLFARYRVSAFPTLVVAAPSGEAVATQRGYTGKKATERFLKQALEKLPVPPQESTGQ